MNKRERKRKWMNDYLYCCRGNQLFMSQEEKERTKRKKINGHLMIKIIYFLHFLFFIKKIVGLGNKKKLQQQQQQQN